MSKRPANQIELIKIENKNKTTVKTNNLDTRKPVLSGHLKIDKTKVLMENGSIMKVKSIAEYSLGAFCNIFDLH